MKKKRHLSFVNITNVDLKFPMTDRNPVGYPFPWYHMDLSLLRVFLYVVLQ